MGSSFQEYQQAQKVANAYALSQRKIQRYTFRYAIISLVGLLFVGIIVPKFILPAAGLAVGVYATVRFGHSLWTGAKHKFLDWKAKKAVHEEGISMEPLLAQTSRYALREKANGVLSQTIASKSTKIAYYAKKSNFEEKEPLSYFDRKHRRALSQYRMLEQAKETALQGDENFLMNFSADRQSRKERKIEILEKIRAYIDEGTVSLAIKHVDSATDCECGVTGYAGTMLLNDIQRWNSADPMNVFLPIPAGLTPIQTKYFVKNTLLPLLIDMDKIVNNPVRQQPIQSLMIKNYPITSEYLTSRIGHLRQVSPTPF